MLVASHVEENTNMMLVLVFSLSLTLMSAVDRDYY